MSARSSNNASGHGSASSKPAALATKHDKSTIDDDCFLPKGFVPGKNDIVIGRSMKYFNHSGNRALRRMVAARLEEYSKAEKSEKSFIITEVMDQIRAKSQNGDGFLKVDPTSGLWYKVGEYLAREKVSQTFRDASGNYRSSSQCKKERRKMERALAYSETEMLNAKRLKYSFDYGSSTPQTQTPPAFVSPSMSPDTIVLEAGNLFDVLATVLPPNYDHDMNPFEPNHLQEKDHNEEMRYEPVTAFEPSSYDTLQPAIQARQPTACLSSQGNAISDEVFRHLYAPYPISLESSTPNTLHAMSA